MMKKDWVSVLFLAAVLTYVAIETVIFWQEYQELNEARRALDMLKSAEMPGGHWDAGRVGGGGGVMGESDRERRRWRLALWTALIGGAHVQIDSVPLQVAGVLTLVISTVAFLGSVYAGEEGAAVRE